MAESAFCMRAMSASAHTFAVLYGFCMAAEKYCLERGVPGRLIPVPREITAGCGLAWKAEVDQEEAVTAALEAAGIAYSGVHRVVI